MIVSDHWWILPNWLFIHGSKIHLPPSDCNVYPKLFSTNLKVPYLCLLPLFHERRSHPSCCFCYLLGCCSQPFVFPSWRAPCWLLRCGHERCRTLKSIDIVMQGYRFLTPSLTCMKLNCTPDKNTVFPAPVKYSYFSANILGDIRRL